MRRYGGRPRERRRRSNGGERTAARNAAGPLLSSRAARFPGTGPSPRRGVRSARAGRAGSARVARLRPALAPFGQPQESSIVHRHAHPVGNDQRRHAVLDDGWAIDHVARPELVHLPDPRLAPVAVSIDLPCPLIGRRTGLALLELEGREDRLRRLDASEQPHLADQEPALAVLGHATVDALIEILE